MLAETEHAATSTSSVCSVEQTRDADTETNDPAAGERRPLHSSPAPDTYRDNVKQSARNSPFEQSTHFWPNSRR
jgi:hypothetical protein